MDHLVQNDFWGVLKDFLRYGLEVYENYFSFLVYVDIALYDLGILLLLKRTLFINNEILCFILWLNVSNFNSYIVSSTKILNQKITQTIFLLQFLWM